MSVAPQRGAVSAHDAVVAHVRATHGLDLGKYRRAGLARGLTERLSATGSIDIEDYLGRFRSDTEEVDALVDAVAVNCSSFFRDPIVFEIFGRRILPELLDRRGRTGPRELRLWSAGCSCGEEPYSLAILVRDLMDRQAEQWNAFIFATDVDRAALAEARQGTYPRARLRDAKLSVVDRFFQKQGPNYDVSSSIRRMVRFSVDDLTSARRKAPPDSIYGAFDVIFCRNVLIYLSSEAQAEVLEKLRVALAPGGYLVLGECESLSRNVEEDLLAVDTMGKIFRRMGGDC